VITQQYSGTTTTSSKFSKLQHRGVRRHSAILNLALIRREVISSESSLIGQKCCSATQRCTTALTNGSTDNSSSDWQCCGVCTCAFNQSCTTQNDFLNCACDSVYSRQTICSYVTVRLHAHTSYWPHCFSQPCNAVTRDVTKPRKVCFEWEFQKTNPFECEFNHTLTCVW